MRRGAIVFYEISKVLGFFATPSNTLIALLALAGAAALLGLSRLARVSLGAGALGLAVAGLSPFANVLIVPLEARFPPPAPVDFRPAGIIVLGGGVEDRVSAATGLIELNEAGDRVLALIALAQRFPEVPIVFSGGVGALIGGSAVPEAEIIRRHIAAHGVDPARLVIEDASRNTVENARFTAALVKPKPGERYLLVTSAFHMPRAMGCFRQAGVPVVAFPVDFRTVGAPDRTRFFGTLAEGLRRTDIAVREWQGLLAYRLAGHTDALFPAP